MTGQDNIEDVVQEVFIKTYQNIRSFDTSQKFSPWIYRIAHNKTISNFRSSAVRSSLSLDNDDYASMIHDDPPSEQRALDSSDKALLEKALNAIAANYREVLVLYYLEEKSYDMIADILEKPPGTIATLLHRAKKSLRAELEKHHYDYHR